MGRSRVDFARCLGAALLLAASSAWARPADAQHAVAVHVESNPAGATVHLESADAAALGTTPLRDVRLPVGSHTLVLRLRNHEEARLAISVSRRGETFRVTLRPLATIEVIADGEGARGGEVRVDGEAIAGVLGSSPLRVDGLAPGRHQVEVSREGHRLESGEVAQVRARLEPVAAVAASPPPPTPEPARVVAAPPEPAPPPAHAAPAPTAMHDASLGVLPSYVDGWSGHGDIQGPLIGVGIVMIVVGGGTAVLTVVLAEPLTGSALIYEGPNSHGLLLAPIIIAGVVGLAGTIMLLTGALAPPGGRAAESGVRFGALEIIPMAGPQGGSVVGRAAS